MGTRSLFSTLRRKYRTGELTEPIQNRYGILSRNLHETLRNWRNFYADLYTENGVHRSYGTSGSDPPLDSQFTNAEFLDCIYTLIRSKAPYFDNISNEDITSLIPDDSSEADDDPQKKVLSLRFVRRILSDFWFNEYAPQIFKRTMLRPFVKYEEKSMCDPSNYRPVSLLDTLMITYEALVCKTLSSYLERNKLLSPFQLFIDAVDLHMITF